MAQQNPMRGYIITHEGDTIQGTIDFLSRSKCTWGCSFRKEGESEFKEYSIRWLDFHRRLHGALIREMGQSGFRINLPDGFKHPVLDYQSLLTRRVLPA